MRYLPLMNVELQLPDRAAGRVVATFCGEAKPLHALPIDDVIDTLKLHGALLLRDFSVDVPAFDHFARQVAPVAVFNESPDRETLDAGSALQTVNLGVDPFPLHPELSREPWRPDVCIFACFEAPANDGQTTICDGCEIVDRLPPALVDTMAGQNLLYIQPASPEVLAYWLGSPEPEDTILANPPAECPYWFRRVGDRIIRGFTRKLLDDPPFSDRPAFANFLLFARDYLRLPNFPCLQNGRRVPDDWMVAVRQAAEPITYAHQWKRGDVLLLDNSRYMHGRRAIRAPRERKIASYFGYLPALTRIDETANPIWRQQVFRPPNSRLNRA